jgi:orotidine-5'-phosphate decarboxylase
MDQADMAELGIGGSVEDEVLRLAGLAIDAGCGGIVTSAKEAPKVRQSYGRSFAVITPGIRPAGAAVGDQARVVTPTDAIRAGVSHMVVGRPITAAAYPTQSARAILEEIAGALRG